jgi:internalin A
VTISSSEALRIFGRGGAMTKRFGTVVAFFLMLWASSGLRADPAEDVAEKAVTERGGTVVRGPRGTTRSVVEVTLIGPFVSDTDLKPLAEFPALETLYLGYDPAQFIRIGKITDLGLKELSGLKSLQTLCLIDVQMTDVGLKELRELKNLKMLFLGGTQITDKGLKELRELKNLQELSLWSTCVTDAGLKELREIQNLESLDLSCTKLTDGGLHALCDFKNLKMLNIAHCSRVTDTGLKELHEVKSLKTLDLTGTKVTSAGLKKLREALPNCAISGP